MNSRRLVAHTSARRAVSDSWLAGDALVLHRQGRGGQAADIAVGGGQGCLALRRTAGGSENGDQYRRRHEASRQGRAQLNAIHDSNSLPVAEQPLVVPLVHLGIHRRIRDGLALGIRYRSEHATLARYDRALALVTASDSVNLGLGLVSETPEGTHARYRGRPGAGIAVVTFSEFPSAPAGQIYQAWARHGATWTAGSKPARHP